MLRVYTRLLLGRARASLGQTALSVGVTAIATALLLIAIVIRGSADAPFERLLDDVGGPHLVLYSSSQGRLDDAAALLNQFVQETAFTARIQSEGSLTSDGTTHPLQFWSLVDDQGTPSNSIQGAGRVVDGRWIEGPGEVVIDSGLARKSGLTPGDEISVAGAAGALPVRVVGTAVVTMRAPYPNWDPAAVFVHPSDLSTLGAQGAIRLATGLRLRDAAMTDAASFTLIQRGGAAPGEAVSFSSWNAIRESIADEITGNVLVLQTFGGFALIAAVLILGNLAAARLIADRRDVGLLKALGLTPVEVGLLYILELTAVAVMAGLLGIGLAYAAAPIFLTPVAELLHTTPAVSLPPTGILAILAVTVGLAALSSLIPGIQAARLATVTALHPSVSGARVSRLARAAGWLRAPLSLRFGLGDAFARPVRAWITILAIGTLGATAAATLTFEATMDGFVQHPERTGIPPFDLVVTPVTEDLDAIEAVSRFAHARNDVVAAITLRDVRVDVAASGSTGRFERVLARTLGGDIEQSGLPLVEGRLPSAVGEVAVGLGLAQRFGIRVGDNLQTALVDGDDTLAMPLVVVGTIVEHANNGRAVFVTHETVEAVSGESTAPGAVALRLVDGASIEAVRAAIEGQFGAVVQVDEARRRLLEEVLQVRDQLRPVMLSLNALLFGIAALNLMIILIITIRERQRELSTLRAVGFTPGQIVGGVLTNAAALGGTGVAIGAPTGYAVVRWLLGGVAVDEGWSSGVIVPPDTLAWVVLAVVAVAVAVASAAVPSWIVTSRPVAAGLRAE